MSRAVVLWCAAGLLLGHVGLLLGNIWLHSEAGYEGMHLASGMAAWRTGSFDAYRVNPPLVRLVAALPSVLVYSEAELPLAEDPRDLRGEIRLGAQLIQRLGRGVDRVVIWGRLACLPFALAGAVACWLWARALAGEAAGLAALALWCISPGVLTYGALTVTDGPAAACTVLAGYAFYTWLAHGEAHRAWWAGLALGVACLAKFTCLVMVPVFALVWGLHRWQQWRAERPRGSATPLWQLALLFAVALLVVNTAYGFAGTLRPLGNYAFTSLRLGAPTVQGNVASTGNRFAGTPLGWVPVPLPALFVDGLDLQWRDLDQPRRCYLAGRWLPKGVWYYYLYGLAVKAPLGHWAMALLAVLCAVGVWREQLQAARLCAVALAVAILVLVSAETNMCEYLRYVLPAAGPFFVWSAAAVCRPGRYLKLRAWAAAACVLASAASVLWHYPHTLAYFNELAGGPLAGPRHLGGDSMDWGQDRYFLERWLAAHPDARPFYTNALYMRLPEEPWAEGVREIPAGPFPEGWYGVTAGAVSQSEASPYAGLSRARQVGRAGYSIYIYRLEPSGQQAADEP
jgi:hypothetical protein